MAASQKQGQKGITLTWIGIILLVVFLFGTWMRVTHLGFMAYHHDESIHAWYAFRLFDQGRFDDGGGHIYTYDPVYHGPFKYHLGALFFLIFGDNDATGRLPYTVFGILTLFLVYQLHRVIGKRRMLFALLLVAISPSLTYFSRFARDDAYIGAQTLALVFFGYMYIKTRRAGFFYGISLALILMYSSKGDSYMIGFILCSFLTLYMIAYILWTGITGEGFGRALRRVFCDCYELVALVGLYGIFSISVFAFISIPFERQAKEMKEVTGDIGRGVAQQFFDRYMEKHPHFDTLILVLAIIAVVIFLGILNLIRVFLETERESENTARDNAAIKKPSSEDGGFLQPQGSLLVRALEGNARLIVGLVIIFSVYCFLFSSMGANPRGLTDGVTDYVRYWYAQKFKPRIAQPEFGNLYYVYFFFHYEIAALVLSLIGIFYLTIRWLGGSVAKLSGPDGGFKFGLRKEGDPPYAFAIFLVYWTVSATVIYTHLHERVPWLLVHMTLPLCILGGYVLGDLFERFRSKFFRAVVGSIAGILILFMLKAQIILIYYNLDNPIEKMIYVQSSRAIREIVKEVQQVAYESGQWENLSVGIQGSAQWPMSWYLRRYRTSSVNARNLINIADPSDDPRLSITLGADFEKQSYSFRDHWSPTILKPLSSEWWKSHFLYFMQRKIWGNPVGGARLMLYKKRQIRELCAGSQTCAPGFDQIPRSGSFDGFSIGGKGSANGQFNEPRGLAIGPNDHLYVADGKNGRVQQFDPNGNWIRNYGFPSPATGSGNHPGRGALLPEVTGPCGVFVDQQGFVYVTDTWGHRIQKFGPDGQFAAEGYISDFFGPRDLVVDPSGRVIVADTGRKRLVILDSNLSKVGEFGMEGNSLGQFIEPVGLAFDRQNLLLVCDTGNKRIQKININQNRAVSEIEICGWQSDSLSSIEPYMAVGPEGNVYLTDSTRKCVYQFNPDMSRVIPWGTEGQRPGQFKKPSGIAVDSQGRVYVTDTEHHQVYRFNPMR